MWRYYTVINWLDDYLMFMDINFIQILLILWSGLFSYSGHKQNTDTVLFYLGILFWVMFSLIQPGAELLGGWNWSQLSVFAPGPDSLAFVTIVGMLILGLPALFYLQSVLWLLFSLLTYIAMDSAMAVSAAFAICIYLISVSIRSISANEVEKL